jgi:sec-independent protein translocase protein TatA
MPNLRGWEWLILLLLVVLLFGAKRLPDAARGLGRSLRIFKAETKGLADDDAAGAPPATAASSTPPAVAASPAPPAPASPPPAPAPAPAVAPAEAPGATDRPSA